MEKITKETCVIFIKDKLRSKKISFLLLSVFIVALIWEVYEEPAVTLIMAAVLISLNVAFGIKVNKQISNVDLLDFYIAEDSVLKRRSIIPGRHSERRYLYTFKKYGKYIISKNSALTFEIALHKEKNVRHLSVQRAALESTESGDLFYLLIVNENGKKKIVKCFYRYYYDLEEDDFFFVDGVYYCKKQ